MSDAPGAWKPDWSRLDAAARDLERARTAGRALVRRLWTGLALAIGGLLMLPILFWSRPPPPASVPAAPAFARDVDGCAAAAGPLALCLAVSFAGVLVAIAALIGLARARRR